MSSKKVLLKKFNIHAQAVHIDKKYIFPDGKIKEKFIIFLSDDIVYKSLVITLTTSNIKDYKGSLRKHIVVKAGNEKVFSKDTVIEIERTNIADFKQIIDKCSCGDIIYKGDISLKLFNKIKEELAECETIEEYIKDAVGVYD